MLKCKSRAVEGVKDNNRQKSAYIVLQIQSKKNHLPLLQPKTDIKHNVISLH